VHEAQADLKVLGVAQSGTDSLRHFGRGQGEHPACDLAELCGRCGHGRAAIGPDGEVSPCIMSEWLKTWTGPRRPDWAAGGLRDCGRRLCRSRPLRG